MTERINFTNDTGWGELGCWIDGHWGQYGPDRLISIAVAQGWGPAEDSEASPIEVALLVELAQDRLDDIGTSRTTFEDRLARFGRTEGWYFDEQPDLADEVENWLNSICPEGYSFGWYDGEFYLQSDEWFERDGEELPDWWVHIHGDAGPFDMERGKHELGED